MKKSKAFKIIKDTREQNGYDFSKLDICSGMIDQKLDTGDYSIVGLEDKICIERKGCVEELANNLGRKHDTFLNEIYRMTHFPHKFIILEFSLEDLLNFPDNTRISYSKLSSVKMAGKYMLKCLIEFQIQYNIHVLFCGNRENAFSAVRSILKRINEMYTTGRTE